MILHFSLHSASTCVAFHYSQKLKKAKQHVAAQKVPRPKASKTLFKTPSSLTSMSNSSSSSFGKPLHKKSTAVKKKGDTGPPQFSTISALSVGGDSNVGTATATNLQLLKSENVGGGQSRKASEGSETTKPPPVLPENLPGEISTLIKAFEEVCTDVCKFKLLTPFSVSLLPFPSPPPPCTRASSLWQEIKRVILKGKSLSRHGAVMTNNLQSEYTILHPLSSSPKVSPSLTSSQIGTALQEASHEETNCKQNSTIFS